MTIEEDARAVGQHFASGCELGLLRARNVHKRPGAGKPPKSEQVRNKVSCAQFAKMAGISERNGQFIYDTWQLAAEEGHCSHAEQLEPEAADPVLSQDGTAEHCEMWWKFYRQVRERRTRTGGARAGGQRNGRTASQGVTQDASRPDGPSPSAPEDHALWAADSSQSSR